ncbi:MAG: hypothetical protein CME59_19595 [Halioglobus sp.]|nr:hypothetical protein [Halioglobus sp.]|tara:strand:+ start:748 stop:1701 length:954 start_codon:yes stop_codon:yes gene_type:complete
MTDHLKLLRSVGEDELFTCLRLLALSVAQHRDSNGFVSLGSSLQSLQDAVANDPDHALGAEVLEEALEAVQVAAAGATEASEGVGESLSPEEKRSQYRINVRIPVKVLWPGESEPVAAQLENISWGGAAIHVDETRLEQGDKLRVILPKPDGGAISIVAKYLRSWDLAAGGQGLAVRFATMSTRDEAELEKLLQELLQSSDEQGQRQHARLSQRLDIHFADVPELQATLDDISAGGLGVTVPEPMQLGQSLQAEISTLDDACHLKLRARVVRQEAVTMGNMEVYHVGLKFEHPAEELQALTGDLLRNITSGDSRLAS